MSCSLQTFVLIFFLQGTGLCCILGLIGVGTVCVNLGEDWHVKGPLLNSNKVAIIALTVTKT